MEGQVVKLPPDLKARWIEALRSGRYKQGTGRLRSFYDEYCCLGVLLDIIDPTRWVQEPLRYTWNEEGCLLPQEIQTELGLAESITISKFTIKNKQIQDDEITIYSLMCCNDIACYNFNQIASIIEEQL
jgi:hypothetical protein